MSDDVVHNRHVKTRRWSMAAAVLGSTAASPAGKKLLWEYSHGASDRGVRAADVVDLDCGGFAQPRRELLCSLVGLF